MDWTNILCVILSAIIGPISIAIVTAALKKQENDFIVFDKIDKMFEDLTEIQRQVFVMTYRDHTRRVETAYNLCISERTVQYIKKEILEKADFIQEN